MRDFRFALRALRRNPGLAAVAILALALGIGANTGIFSIVDAVLLRPLPYPQPQELTWLANGPGWPLTGPDFLDWQRQNRTFQAMALFTFTQPFNLSGAGRPVYVRGVQTEANFFSLLGVPPLLGRAWAPGEDQPGHGRVVILSYGLWQSQFAASPAILGRAIELDDRAYTVVGVMPRGFAFPARAELWTPMDMSPAALGVRGSHQFLALGRLKPGATVAQAQADLSLVATRLARQYPESNTGVGAWVKGLQDVLVGQARPLLLLMLWAVALVLLIACVNIANLLLARAAARQKEIAIRSALGAGRGRIVRQLLTESVTLALLGGLAGLGLAELALRLILALPGFPAQPPHSIALDGSVLAFTFALAIATGIAFGLVPAWQLSRQDAHDELRGGALLIVEIGLCLALTVAAGLVVQSFARLRATDFGVRRNGVLTARVNLPAAKYGQSGAKILAFTRALSRRVAALPGVVSAAITDHLPLEGGSNGTITLFGQPANTNSSSSQWVEMHGVSPDYFAVMGIPLLRGRLLTAQDVDLALRLVTVLTAPNAGPAQTRAAVCPVVINRRMTQMFWPNANPLGQKFSYNGANGPWLEVVGVVGDTRQWGLQTPPHPEEYEPFVGYGYGGTILVVHTAVPPLTLLPAVRGAVAQLDSSLPLYDVRSMREVIADHTADQRFQSVLLGIFAGLALLLAAVGIYGVMSYLVVQRTREIGVRISLGASRAAVLRLVLGRGAALALAGIALGLAAALAGGRLLASLLYGVRAGDPVTLAAAAVFLFAVALLACWLPARRAARVDPVRALRCE